MWCERSFNNEGLLDTRYKLVIHSSMSEHGNLIRFEQKIEAKQPKKKITKHQLVW